MSSYLVYMHITPSNKVYIGITSKQNPKRRWGGGCGYQRNKHFYNAIKKYGWENIEHIVVESGLSEQDAKALEKQLIAKHNSMEKGYNKTAGGDGLSGYHLTEETKEKIRRKSIGRKPAPLTPEGKAKMREVLLGHEVKPETRRKLSEYNLNGGNAKAKTINQIDDDGNLLATYISMREAERATGIRHEHISACITGKQNRAGGFRWEPSPIPSDYKNWRAV